MKRTFFFSLCCLLVSLRLSAASLPVNTDGIAKSVVFIFDYSDPRGAVLGTGFLVQLRLKTDPKLARNALVTARHVVDPQWAGCARANPATIFIRVNKKNYKPESSEPGVEFLPINLVADGRKLWLQHNDDEVDAVVIPLLEAGKVLANDVQPIGFSDFGTKTEFEKYSVGIGDGVLSAGLVPNLVGMKRNYPAFKFGKISNIFKEPVETSCGPGLPPRPSREWLIAGEFVPGNSGSPVILLPLEFTLGAGLNYNGPRAMLIGLLSSSLAGAGLGEMVPVEYINEIFEQNFSDCDLNHGDIQKQPGAEKPKG